MAAASIDRWINALYLQISELLDNDFSSKKVEYTFSMIHYTSFNKKDRIRQVKVSFSLWEKTPNENKKLWTKIFPNRSEALEFLSSYLDKIQKQKLKKSKGKKPSFSLSLSPLYNI